MKIKYFNYITVCFMTNRDLWDTYQSYKNGELSVVKGSLLLREIAKRSNCLDYLSENRSSDAVSEVLEIFSTYKLNGAGDEIF